jgi:hypothetical protein
VIIIIYNFEYSSNIFVDGYFPVLKYDITSARTQSSKKQKETKGECITSIHAFGMRGEIFSILFCDELFLDFEKETSKRKREDQRKGYPVAT